MDEPHSDARRDIDFRYDSQTREMRISYDPNDTFGCRKELVIAPWSGQGKFYVDEARAADCGKWLIAVSVRGTPPADLEVKYELADFDPFTPAPA